MSIQPEDARTQAIETLANRKFHHLFTLPSTPTHGPLKVTYSIAGIEKGDVPTILFCAGMFGGRWLALYTDYLATKGGVRILYFDRFVLAYFPRSTSHIRTSWTYFEHNIRAFTNKATDPESAAQHPFH